MQEHIYRAQESDSKQRSQQPQRHTSSSQSSRASTHINVEQSQQQQQQQQRDRQQQQVLQSKIVTPTKTAQYELLAVKEVFYQVEEAFKTRELEKNKLQEQIIDKENQIKYCEEETKKQAEAIGVVTASNSFRNHKLNQLDLDCNRFNDDVVDPLRARCKDMEEKLAIGNEMVEELEKDLVPLTILAHKQRELAEILAQMLTNMEFKDEAETIALSKAVDSLQAIELRLQTQQEELIGLKLRKERVDSDFKAAEQNLANMISDELEKRKSLKNSEDFLEKSSIDYNNAFGVMQIELSSAERSVALSELEEQKLEDEITILSSEMASQDEMQTAVLKTINELEADKDFNRKGQTEANERMSHHVLERRRLTSLIQEAETRRDDLRAEILQSTVDLEKTTDRAKEYERNMQDSYTLMGQNMAAQYELQKLEPALRCELYQLQLALSIKISELSLVVESAEADALQEEENLIEISEEIKKRTHELEQLEEDVTRELNEIESLQAHNAATTGIIIELSSLERNQRAELDSKIMKMDSIQAMEADFDTQQTSLNEMKSRTSQIQQQCADDQERIEIQSIMLAENTFQWEPLESSRKDVAALFEMENLCMMQDLDADFRAKETEIMQHTNKLKEGFKIPAAWGAKVDNINTNLALQKDTNHQVQIEIKEADEKLFHLRECQENVKRQILMLKNQINDLTADDASEKNQDVKERAAANLINEALLGEEFDDDRMTQESLDLDSEVEAEGMLTQRSRSRETLKHRKEQSKQSKTKSQSLSKHHMKAKMPILATAPKDKASQEQQSPAAMQSILGYTDQESEVNTGGKESNSNEVDNHRTYTAKIISPKVGLGVKSSHRKVISSTNKSSKSDLKIIRAKQSELEIFESQSERETVRDSDNRSQSTSQNQHLADDIASPPSQLYAERTSSSSMDPEYPTTMDGLDCNNVLESRRLKARHLNVHDKRTNKSKADVVDDELDTSIKDDDGWVTESSACFEDTLFADAPKKTKTASLAKGMKLSSSTAAFVPFGEIAVATTYKNFIMSRNQTTLNANIDSTSQAPTRKSSNDEKDSSRTVPYIYGQQSMDRLKDNTNLSLQRVQKRTLEYGSKGDCRASGTETVEISGGKINPMSPPAMPSTIHEKYSNKLGVVNATGPRISKVITKTAVTVRSSVVNKTNLISMRSAVPLKRKPLSSAGLTSIKRADSDQIHKSAKRAVTSIASDNIKSLRRPPIYSQSQKSLASEGKVENSLSEVKKSSKMTQDDAQPEESRMMSSQQKGSKDASPGDWFDDDIKF